MTKKDRIGLDLLNMSSTNISASIKDRVLTLRVPLTRKPKRKTRKGNAWLLASTHGARGIGPFRVNVNVTRWIPAVV